MSFHSSCTTHPSARGWEPHTPGATDQGAAQAMYRIGVATRLPARAAHSSRPTASDSAPPPTVAVLTGAEELERALQPLLPKQILETDRKSTRLNSSHVAISYAVFCLKKKT